MPVYRSLQLVYTRRRDSLALRLADLELAAPWVIALLDKLLPLASSSLSIALKLFVCFEVWVHHCRIAAAVVAGSSILGAVFAAVSVPELFDAAVDCIVQLVRTFDSPMHDMPMVRLLIPGVMSLAPLFDAGVRNEDDDQAKGVCRVFAETGESYLDLILGEDEIDQARAMHPRCVAHDVSRVMQHAACTRAVLHMMCLVPCSIQHAAALCCDAR
jgi:hypothetical protein